MAVLLAGLPTTIPGATINRLCGSSLDAAMQASRAIEAGDASIVLVGGRRVDEPRAVGPAQARARASPADTSSSTRPRSDGGWSTPNMPEQWTISLGQSAEKLAGIYEISREAQDEFALRSHQRAHGRLGRRLLRRAGSCRCPDTELERDETVRPDTSLEKLAKLKPAFVKDGTGDRRQLLAAQRRRRRDAARRRGRRATLGREPLARVVGARRGRRRPRRVRDRARGGRQPGAEASGNRLG